MNKFDSDKYNWGGPGWESGSWNPLKWIECFAGLIFFSLALSLIFGGLG